MRTNEFYTKLKNRVSVKFKLENEDRELIEKLTKAVEQNEGVLVVNLNFNIDATSMDNCFNFGYEK